MTNFEFAVQQTLEKEGLFTIDTGGRTMYGITEKLWLAYGDGLTSITSITKDQAISVYKRAFWDAMLLDAIEDKHVAAEIFDTAVNCGITTATLITQRALNYLSAVAVLEPSLEVVAAVEAAGWLAHGKVARVRPLVEDGQFGPITRKALNVTVGLGYKVPLLVAQNGEQYLHYKSLVWSNQKFKAYARGWTKRLMLTIGN
jgi:lysozyme family protein